VRANYHTHSTFCDGKASPAEMARAARKAGYEILGFSSHSPFPHGEGWAMRPECLGEYAAEIGRLKAAWAPGGAEASRHGHMEVLLGLEVDWFPGERRPADGAFATIAPDYLLGSVHYVEVEGSAPFTVDSSEAHFDASLAELAARHGREEAARLVYEDYYRRLGAMIEDGGFAILGHFDLVKKNNVDFRVFDETESRYLDAAFEAASRLVGKGIVAEVNLGGMARGKTKEPYPSLAIMEELHRLGVPVTFTADAHEPEHLGVHLDAARELARKAGYESISVFSHGTWIESSIGAT
jgi:histidinol-phosphatase (PHP family)